MDTSLFRILFTKFYSFRNSGLQVTDIQKKKGVQFFLKYYQEVSQYRLMTKSAIT